MQPSIYYVSNRKLISNESRIVSIDCDKAFNSIINNEINHNNIFGLDTETNSLNPIGSKLWFIQIGNKDYQFIFDYQSLSQEELNKVKTILSNPDYFWIGHNLKHDFKFLTENIYDIKANYWDTMIADQLITLGYDRTYTHDLATVLNRYLPKKQIKLDKSTRDNFVVSNYTPIVKDIIYSAEDVIYLEELYLAELELIKKFSLERVNDLEQKAIKVYQHIETNGIKLDVAKWKEITLKQKENLNNIEIKICNIIQDYINNCKDEFKAKKWQALLKQGSQLDIFGKFSDNALRVNLGSAKSVIPILRDLLGLNVAVRKKVAGGGKKDAESSGDEVLKKYLNVPFVQAITEWRECNKKIDSFGDKFLDFIYEPTGNIHASFFQLGTATGRVSNNKPNLQQIPRDEEYRHCFIANEGNSIITLDYSGCELRIIAELTQEQAFIEAFAKGEDLHSTVATMVFGVPVSKKENAELRQITKNINFGLAYGAGADKLAELSGKPVQYCEEVINKYFKLFPKIKSYLDEVSRQAIKNCYVKTHPLGRRRWFPYAKGANFFVQNKIGREAKNMPIQGANADLIKLASINVLNYFQDNNIDAKIIHQVHDELVIETKTEIANDIATLVHNIMVEAGKFISKDIVFEVEYKIEKTWAK